MNLSMLPILSSCRHLAVPAIACAMTITLGCVGPLSGRRAENHKRLAAAADDDSIPAAASVGLADNGEKPSGDAEPGSQGKVNQKKTEKVAELEDDGF